jgi:hypothetical protein
MPYQRKKRRFGTQMPPRHRSTTGVRSNPQPQPVGRQLPGLPARRALCCEPTRRARPRAIWHWIWHPRRLRTRKSFRLLEKSWRSGRDTSRNAKSLKTTNFLQIASLSCLLKCPQTGVALRSLQWNSGDTIEVFAGGTTRPPGESSQPSIPSP